MKSLFERLSDAVNTDEDRMGLLASLLDNSVREVAVDGLILVTDRVVIGDSAAGVRALTLPLAEDMPGQAVYVKRQGANDVTVDANAADTDGVDGGTLTLATDGDSAKLIPYKKGWLVISSK